VKVDVRIIAATHQNLENLVNQGSFREDLFHRLNVIRVHVPPLSERRVDIPLLARHFLEQTAKELNDEPKRLSPEAEKFMTLLQWPGNVRQLENTCRWLHVMGSTRQILKSDFPPELFNDPVDLNDHDWEKSLKFWALAYLENQSSEPLLDIATPIFERIMIESALQKTNGRKQEAAKLLGWGRNTLTRKLQELDL
jgi:two-component system nitrogen regulation response regulator GlnG